MLTAGYPSRADAAQRMARARGTRRCVSCDDACDAVGVCRWRR